MVRKKSCNNRRAGGFTLIELMIAITIVTMVVSIVYASFAAVANGTEEARNAALELRSRAFLSRNFSVNLAQITDGWLPGAQGRSLQQATSAAQPAGQSFEVRFAFLGEDIDGPLGPADKFGFVTSTPLMGAQGLPGFPKYVTYEVITEQKEAEDPDAFEEEEAEAILQIIETPVMSSDPNATSFDSAGSTNTSFGDDDEEPSPFSDVSWTVAIESMNVQYYDGQTLQWVDSWDSDQRGYLPWAVDIKINFPPDPNEEDDDKRDVIEEPDFRLLFSLPPGVGQKDPTPGYQPPRDPYRDSLLGVSPS